VPSSLRWYASEAKRIFANLQSRKETFMKSEVKVAIVTGAGRGIGRATALGFARAGTAVVLAARTQKELEATAEEVRALGAKALPLVVDVAREAEVKGMVDQAVATFNRVDILVNNAGAQLPRTPVVDLATEEWNRILQVNLTGSFLCAKAVLPIMMRQRSGKIINVASLGAMRGVAGGAPYCASKAALVSFTYSLAAEVKAYGIDVNAVCPAGTDTRLLRDAGLAKGRTNLNSSEEMANVILFLASPESSAITGSAVLTYGLSNPLFGPV
jgi:NAD(P)-dependent dehydrogenase (short-subunit alcohol dehydrogenase family)